MEMSLVLLQITDFQTSELLKSLSINHLIFSIRLIRTRIEHKPKKMIFFFWGGGVWIYDASLDPSFILRCVSPSKDFQCFS